MQTDRLLTIDTVLDRLAVKRTKLYALLGAGKLSAVKNDGKTCVRESEVNRYLDSLPAATFRAPAQRQAA